MPSITLRQTKAGELRWQVRFRLNGSYSSRTYESEEAARSFAQLCDDLGSAEAALRYEAKHENAATRESITLDKQFAEFVATRTGVEERTIVDYRRIYDRHIGPTLGKLPLGAIDRTHIARLINALARGTSDRPALSAKSIANVHGILSAAFNDAVSRRVVESNPCIGMRLPRTHEVESTGERFLTHAEFDRLYTAISDHYKPLALTLVGTGMRWSEATALRAGEVDLDGLGTIKIIRATKWIPGEGHVDGVPKTKKSRRTVIVPSQVREAIRPLVEGKRADEYVFTSATGKPVRHATFHRLVWKKAVAKADLSPAPRIHDLRHTHASWLLEMGIGLEAIQDQLGHESIMTTRKIYGHLQPAMREALQKAAEAALSVQESVSQGALTAPVDTPALPGAGGPA